MLPALILALAALIAALLRLLSYRRQMMEMAQVLEETPAQSNVNLTLRMSGAAPKRLCRAVNARLRAGRQLQQDTLRGERELKYTMACISHDIRTPLAGAMGYLQLLEGMPERREEYLSIVKKRLEDLEELLDQLFLYTRLLNNSFPMECAVIQAVPLLWEALADFYPQLEAAHIRPELEMEQEDMPVRASPEALGRVYRNLLSNALRHGGGGLKISARDNAIRFCNPLGPGPQPDPEHLFDRFYQSSPARGNGGGLGLAITRELMEQMGGKVSARLAEGELEISLSFARPEKPSS